MNKAKLISSLFGYSLLVYLLFQASVHLYEPGRNFDLPGLLWFTHLMLLYIHEAGHFFFKFFGHAMYILGGSLFQVIVPAAWFFVAKREESSLANVALFFTGVSIVDVSIYVKDAGMLQLPLIGGLSKSHHDWANLANEFGFLDYSYAMGEVMFWCGIILSAAAIFLGVKHAITQYKEAPQTPDYSSD
ncbi:MAG: hypothetical protein PHP42_05325 [Bacteroidota bacterium]|nr:hypothetical protein [Bacteroidota bacterium]